ncbi:unnamed protein product [Victoria cruziana]
MAKTRRVVLFPTPGVGHLVSTMELAKQILHHTHNLSITIFIIRPPSSTPFFVPSSVISQYQDAVAAAALDIDFTDLPQLAVPEVEGQARLFAFMDNHAPVVSDALAALQKTTTIAAFIADMFCISSTAASLELGIPTFVFFTSGATTLCLFTYLPEMDRKYERDIKELTEDLQLPGSVRPLPPAAIPAVLRTKEEHYRWFLRNAHLYFGLDGILVNTFNELQPLAFEAWADGLCCPGAPAPPAYAVGPMLSPGTELDSKNHDCIKWLDRQPDSSVLFLCFGSRGAFPTDQIHEIARGLELSGQRFLWSLRVGPDPAPGTMAGLRDADLDEVLPAGFVERTNERGMVWPKWAPQVAILSHPAVAGFVSHCGWNSTLESVWYGVPMIAWPLYAEQGMNAFELVNVLGVGLAIRNDGGGGDIIRAEELERAVRSLMEGEEGRKVREKMKETKELGRKAVEEGGSSFLNMAKLVESWTG